MCLKSRCVPKHYNFDTKAGLAYIIYPGRIVVVDRFDFKNIVDTLEQKKGASETSPYYTSDEIMKYDAERAKHADESKQRESEDAATALAVVTERRTKNLPLVKKIGARICQEKTESGKRPGYSDPFVYVGFVESIANDKVQIRISDAYRKNTKSRPDGFSPSIIWDSPMNWDLCE